MTAPRKPWLQDAKARVQRLKLAVDDRYVQLRHGAHSDARAEIMDRVAAIPGGAELLNLAQQHKVKILVVNPASIDDVQGRFSRGPAGVFIRVANRGDIARMTTTLWHELRHMQQHIDRGDMAGRAGKLHNARAEHVIGLMIEADAFTAQTVMAVQQARGGRPEYLEAMLSRDGPAMDCIREFLKKNQPPDFSDDRHFARALFTEMMREGLPRYSAKYFERHRNIFQRAATAEKFRKLVKREGVAPKFLPTDRLLDTYLHRDDPAPSVSALARKFFCEQPREAQETLALIEDTVQRAKDLSQSEFKQARNEIIDRTTGLSARFNSAAARHAKPKSPGYFRRLRNSVGL
ncbi:MAG TPA: DUF6782 family putative metallopeptidase [Patescibacteria group bacterium]|nr:DUF6782 family putative metallopeptidase [Patescibacteria group bacterium]